MKKIVFTGGGSAGHVLPNVAIIQELLKKGTYDVSYFGSDGIEKELVSALKIPYYQVDCPKLYRGHDFHKNVQNLSEKKYKLSVIVVEGDEFFGTNVTCMAAWCSCGNRVIPFETFIRRHSRR